MKKVLLILLGIAIIFIVFIVLAVMTTKKKSDTMALYMQLTSPTFKNNTSLPKDYSCDGKGINPPLAIFEAPKDAKSMALIVTDPDAPMGTFTHWVVYNIDPLTKEISENSVPTGSVQGKTSVGKPGFVAACPPNGQHRYFFALYALDTMLPADSNMDRLALEKVMKGHVLNSSVLLGLYKR